jgi:hypothetical protein
MMAWAAEAAANNDKQKNNANLASCDGNVFIGH